MGTTPDGSVPPGSGRGTSRELSLTRAIPQESSEAPGMNRCSVPSASLTRPRNGVQEPWTPDDHTGRKREIARYPLQSLANPQLVECMYLRARVSHASRMQVDFAALPLTEWISS